MFTNTVYTDFFYIIEKATENTFSKIYKIYWIIIINHHGPSRTLQNTLQHCFDRFVFL